MIPDLIVSLAVVSNDIDLDATWQLLRKFGGGYEAIADPRFRRPHVSDIPANWLLLQQLQSAGVVAKFGADNERRDIWVTLRQS